MARRSPRARRVSRSVRLLRGCTLAIVLAIGLAYVQPVQSYLAARGEVERAQRDLSGLKRENSVLRMRLGEVGTDRFLVQEARKLGLVHPGERLFIVRDVHTGKSVAERLRQSRP